MFQQLTVLFYECASWQLYSIHGRGGQPEPSWLFFYAENSLTHLEYIMVEQFVLFSRVLSFAREYLDARGLIIWGVTLGGDFNAHQNEIVEDEGRDETTRRRDELTWKLEISSHSHPTLLRCHQPHRRLIDIIQDGGRSRGASRKSIRPRATKQCQCCCQQWAAEFKSIRRLRSIKECYLRGKFLLWGKSWRYRDIAVSS